MAGERLPARFSLRSQIWFRWTGKCFETATSHMQNVGQHIEMAAFQSTKKYYHFYRYGLGAMALFIIGLTVTLILTETEISINDEDVVATWTNTWFLFVVSLILLAFHGLLTRKASYVQIFSDTISVESSDGTHEYNLKDVEVLEQVQFLQPPFYRLKIKGAPRTYIFVLNAMYLEFGGFVKDLSDDRNQLEKIKNTLPNKS